MQRKIDLNCDLGEGMVNDEALMPYISSANIACGYHAGNAEIVKRTIDLCVSNKVAIGAHPGFNDRVNFGRVEHQLPLNELIDLVVDQLQLIAKQCASVNAKMHHVKLHGALYNMSAKNAEMSKVIAKAIYEFDPTLVYYGLSGTCMISEAKAIGLKVVNEVFADRTYLSTGMLTPRNRPDALLISTTQSLAQVKKFLHKEAIESVDGAAIFVEADTICLHGDGTHALEFAKSIHTFLVEQQVVIQPPSL
jgi:5-oxoprolinase (ATP-hydrolysing) subunit A